MNSPEMKITKFGMENVIATSGGGGGDQLFASFNGFYFTDSTSWNKYNFELRNFKNLDTNSEYTNYSGYMTYNDAINDIGSVTLVVKSGLPEISTVGGLLNMMTDGKTDNAYDGIYKFVNDGAGVRFVFVRTN